MMGVIRWAFKLMKDLEWCSVISDKDGSNVVVRQKHMRLIHSKVVESDDYEPAETPEPSCLFPDYKLLSKRMASLSSTTREEWFSSMARFMSAWRGKSKLQASLILTIKTHKLAGEVWVRDIHVNVNDKLSGVCRWIVDKLRPIAI